LETFPLSRLGAEREWEVDDFRVPYPLWTQSDNGSVRETLPNRGGHSGEKVALTERGYLLVV
jgi:hypothetical protein